jgi:UDP-GlcNAc:undecaprenyl-phosphate GlcNAc-1-phosphate transferase
MFAFIRNLGFSGEILAFLASFLISFAVIVFLRRFWKWRRGLDAGDGVRKLQSEPVLRVGGIALYASFTLAFRFASDPTEGTGSLLDWPFFLLGTTMFLLGFADDLFRLPALLRLSVQIAVGVAAYSCGLRIDLLSHPLDGGTLDTGGFGLVLTVIWFVSIPNLINLVDGMDGLAGGIALFLSVTLATLGAVSGHAELLTLSIAMSGGIVAFLAFNLPPARIYMGDGGAYLLGFSIAGASLISSNKGSIFGSLLVVVIVLGFPILDTTLAMLRRGLSGLPLMRADALHLHHRLQTLGFSKRNILFVLYGIFAGLSLLGLSVFLSAGYTLPIVGMVATIGIIQGFRFLGLPHNLKEVRDSLRDMVSARKDVRYAYAMAQVLEHDLDRVPGEAVFWDSLRGFLSRLEIEPCFELIPDSGEETRKIVVLRLDGRTFWVIHCPRPEGSPEGSGRRWERVARCFIPVIMGARARWGQPLPKTLGFFEASNEEELGALENSLRTRGGASAAALLSASLLGSMRV